MDGVPQLQQLGFTVDPQKGTLEPGTKKTITVSWTPSAGHDLNAVVEAVAILTLKGSATEQVRMLLRAFVTLPTKPRNTTAQRSVERPGSSKTLRANTPTH